MKRRSFLRGATVLAGAAVVPGLIYAADKSPLIYLSPLQSNGELSRCQGEVWFVAADDNMFVVTDTSAWRAQAIRQGLSRTQIWVGDVGLWQRSNGRYKNLPSMQAEGSLVDDAVTHASVLRQFGDKYADEWGRWGPRFKGGLADGSRVLLRYQPA